MPASRHPKGLPMTSRHLWPILLATGVAQAASLPLSPGTYVRADVTCDDPPFAATFDYDGHRFSYPHASNCRSTIVSRQGRTYRVRETCSALGDGSPARPDTNLTAYTIASPRTGDGAPRRHEQRHSLSALPGFSDQQGCLTGHGAPALRASADTGLVLRHRAGTGGAGEPLACGSRALGSASGHR